MKITILLSENTTQKIREIESFFSRVFWPEYIYFLISSIEAEYKDIDEQDDKSENQPSTSSPVKTENSTHNPIIIPDLENNSPNISSNPTSSSISVGGAIVQRSSCPYGSDCNRKNPMHFQSEAHPGDSDYREETEQNSNFFFLHHEEKLEINFSFFSYIGIYFFQALIQRMIRDLNVNTD